MRHDRSGAGAVTFALYAFERLNEVDERGYFRSSKHHVVCFRFEDIALASFAAQDDTLDELRIGEECGEDGRFVVTLISAIGNEEEGFGGSFSARSGVVLSVVPTHHEHL